MSSVVNIFVVSPDTRSERRLDLHITIGSLKSKLELITGIPANNQSLSLHSSEESNQIIAVLDDDTKSLGFYGTRDYQALKVEDTNPSSSLTGQLTDVSQVEKYEISDEAYAKRQDTVLAYKQRHQVGRFAPKDQESPKAIAVIPNIPIGSRCQIETSEKDFLKRGTVRFAGETKFSTQGGVWVGIEYDEPFGKNDGSVQGERYFSCKPNYGAFVRPDRVQVGDFPEVGLDIDEEI